MSINNEPGSIPPSEAIHVKMTETERLNFGALLLERVEKSRTGMRQLLNRMKDWRNFYESDLPEKTFPWKNASNVNVPLTQWHVDSFQAHISRAILGVTPYTLIRPVEPADKERALQVETFLQNVEQAVMNVPIVVKDAITEGLLAGACIPKLSWREEYRTVKEIVPDLDEFTGQPVGTRLESATEPKYRGPKLEFVDLRNFVIYPLSSPTIDDAIMVGDRFVLSKDQLNRRIKSGFYDKEYADKVLEKPDSEQSTAQDTEDDENLAHEGIEAVEEDIYYFWEVITGYDVNGDGLEEDCLVTFDATNGVIVRIVEYPYWHGRRNYIPFVPYRRPNTIFGRSLPQLVEHMQREINTIHNQRSDAIQMAIAKPFKLSESSELKEGGIVISPGATIRVQDMDELQELDIDPIVPGLDIETMARDYSERATGINDISLGRQSEGDKTAREVGIVAAEGGIRFGDVIENLQLSMTEIAKQVLGLCYQFMSDAEIAKYSATQNNILRITNVPGATQEQLTPLSRHALRTQFDYVPHGTTSTANLVQRREEAMLLHRELFQSPLVQSKLQRLHRLEQDILLAFDRRDYENYIGTADEVAAQEKKREQEMAQQQQMAQQKEQSEIAGNAAQQGQDAQAAGEQQAIDAADRELANAS